MARGLGHRTAGDPVALGMTAALGLALIAVFVAVTAPTATVVDVAVPVVVALAYGGAGMVAWARRPHNRSGPLLVLTGMSFLAAGLDDAALPALRDAGLVLASLPLALVLHVVMAFPSGQLPGRLPRVIVGLGYVVAIGLGLPPVPFVVQAVAGIALLLAATVVLVARHRRAGPVLRSALGPIIWYAPAMLLLVIGGAVAVDVADGSGFTGGPPANTAAAGQVLAVLGFPVVFLLGLSRGSFARAGEVSELLAASEDALADPAALQAALARALGDGSVRVWYRRAHEAADFGPVADRFGVDVVDLVDADGLALQPPAPPVAMRLVRLGGDIVGAFTYNRSVVADDALLAEIADLAALLFEHQRVAAGLRARVRDLAARDAELQAAQERIVRAADDERRRISRDLHDGAQQRIVALGLQAQRIARKVPPDAAVAQEAAELADGAGAVLDELRALIAGIMPVVLEERGLEPAARSLAARAPIAVDVRVSGLNGRLETQIETTAYFVVAEAITNAIKHADTDRVDVELRRDAGALVVAVRDHGVGGADPAGGTGLSGLTDRVHAVGGSFRVEEAPGGGVRVRAEIPCAS